MENNKGNIDEFFQVELGNYTEMPPSSVWESLEKRLDQRSDKPKRIWWLYLLVAAIFVGGSIAAYFIASQNNSLKLSKHKNESFEGNSSSNSFSNPPLSEINNGIVNSESKIIDEEVNGPAVPPLSEKNNLISEAASTSKSKHTKAGRSTEAKNHTSENTEAHQKENGLDSGNNSTPQNNSPEKINSSKTRAGRFNENSLAKNQSPSGKQKESSENMENTQSQLGSGENTRALNQKKKSNAAHQSSTAASVTATKPKTIKASLSNDERFVASATTPKTSGVNSKSGSNSNLKDPKEPVKAITQTNDVEMSAKNTSPEKSVAKKQNSTPLVQNKDRGLSAFPEEDAEELSKNDAIKDKDSDLESEQTTNQKSSTSSKLLLQAEAIEKVRSSNPLAAAPVAANEIDESTDINGKEIKSSAGGGGGGAASKGKKEKKSLNMAIGVKMGYEQGTQKFTAGKYVGTIFAEVNFSKKLSFVMQPSIKFGTVNRQISGGNFDTFVNADGVQSSRQTEVDSTGKPTGFYNYYISQKYDSMAQSAVFKKQFIEIEIPFLFRYRVDKNFSVLAGVNFLFGKTLGYTVSENKLSGGFITDSVIKTLDTTSVPVSGRFFSEGISGKSAVSSDLSAPISPVRFGYTIGLSYVFRERLMMDLLIQQNLSGTSDISNAEVRKIFEQPYVRLSLGYTIFGNKKK